jgi:hypothetical protein
MNFRKIEIFSHLEIRKILSKLEEPSLMKKMIYSFNSVSENMTKRYRIKSKIYMEHQFFQEAIILL